MNTEDSGYTPEKELTDEELADLMGAYKNELARIYRLASAKKKAILKNKTPGAKQLLVDCDRDMQADIEALKKTYGIHY